jgi:hypothetical protein
VSVLRRQELFAGFRLIPRNVMDPREPGAGSGNETAAAVRHGWGAIDGRKFKPPV